MMKIQRVTAPARPSPFVINQHYLDETLPRSSTFKRFILSTFDGYENATDVLSAYRIGGTTDDRAIFWQIDAESNIRSGKIMAYNEVTGKRIKAKANAISWIHSSLKKSGVLPPNWELRQCLFGEHLLPSRPCDKICIVEAEKTAIIAAILMPKYIWLATGGKSNFRPVLFEPLAGREIVLFPDLGAYDDWNLRMKSIDAAVPIRYSISRLLEDNATLEERQQGLDIADYLLRQVMNK